MHVARDVSAVIMEASTQCSKNSSCTRRFRRLSKHFPLHLARRGRTPHETNLTLETKAINDAELLGLSNEH